ncbi:hypothetical protein Hanom_Chr15g01372791 [Helianthus anomalus]
MRSSLPYVVLGILYAYLLYLSWTPDTIQLLFASKYWLPEVYFISNELNWSETTYLLLGNFDLSTYQSGVFYIKRVKLVGNYLIKKKRVK